MPIPRQAIRQSRARRAGRIHSVSAPIGGWNARDSVDRMAEQDAVLLDNWFPDEGEVRVRKGHTQHSTGMSGSVELLAEYHYQATQKFLGAAGGAIWDVTASAASQLASGFSSNRWQWANFEGEMGLVNGSDNPQKFGGSAISALSITASAAATVSSFIGIQVHGSRTYFWQSVSQDFYYSAVNALGGTLTRFPLGRIGQFGGNLLTMETWSRDGGDGMDDLAVFIMDSGETIVYQGTNPGDATDWGLVGVFHLPKPIARRATVKFGGDVIIATQQGYFPLSSAFQGRVGQSAAISTKISGAVRDAAASYGDNFGWEAIAYYRGHWLLFNVPRTTDTTYVQHVMNTVTGSWCRFTGMNARTWGIYKGELYFGGDGEVFKADTGFTDDGADINADAQPAYTYLGARQIRKQLTGIQPVFSAEGDVNFELSIGSDFSDPTQPAPNRTATTSGASWDSAVWDEASWSGGLFIVNRWRLVSGLGYNFGARFAVRINNVEVRWFASNFLFKPAGMI